MSSVIGFSRRRVAAISILAASLVCTCAASGGGTRYVLSRNDPPALESRFSTEPENSIAIGYSATVAASGASDSYITAIGANSSATGEYATAIGGEAVAGAANTMALGGTGGAVTSVVINGTTASAQMHINASSTSMVGLLVNGFASATADLQDWQVNGTSKASMDHTGSLTIVGLTASGAATVGGTLGVTGALSTSAGATIGTSLTVTDSASVGTTLGVTGDTTLGGTLDVSDATTLSGQFSPNSTYTPGSQFKPTITLAASDPPVLECDTTSAVTVKLPTSPRAGQMFTILDAHGTAGLHNITIDGNGNDIYTSSGGATTIPINTNYGCIVLRYLAGGGKWTVISQFNS